MLMQAIKITEKKRLPYLVITKKGNRAGKPQKNAYVSHQNFLFWKLFPYLVITKKGKLCKMLPQSNPSHQKFPFLEIFQKGNS